MLLTSEFFKRKTSVVAKDLLGKFLVRAIPTKAGRPSKFGKKELALMINEVEVYDGQNDLSSHARHGPLKRGKLMFGEPGVWYVYFTYGMHYMLNITAREKGYPAAILIRGLEGIIGPGRLTKALGVNLALNGKAANKKSGLWIEDRGVTIKKNNELRITNNGGIIEKYRIISTPRIGIDHSGPIWASKKLRFALKLS